jgi:hypothetical protein
VFDRGPTLDGATGVENIAAFTLRPAHEQAIRDGLAHFAGLLLIEFVGERAVVTSYLMIIHLDHEGRSRGARGVGPKGAADLLKRHGTLDGILAAGLFPTKADNLHLFRSIATMSRKAPLPSLATQKPTWTKAADLARAWGLNQLADRLKLLGNLNAGGK